MTTVAELGVESTQLAEEAQALADLAESLDLAAFLAGTGVAGDAAVLAAAPIELDPVVLCIGLVALIIAVAFKWLVAMPLAWLVSKIPFVGGTLSGWVQDAGDWEWNTVSGWAHDAMQALWWLLQMLIHLIKLPVIAVQVLLATALLAFNTANEWVPYYYRQSINYADAWGHELLNDLAATASELVTDIYVAYNLSVNHANNLYNLATGYATQLYDNSIGYAQALFRQAEADIAATREWVVGDLDALEQKVDLEIGRAEVQAQEFTESLVEQSQTALDATIAAGIAAATAVAEGIGNTLRNLQAECLDDLCEANNQQAKNAINLASLLTSGAVFAFFAAAIRDPEGTANASAPVLVPVGAAAGTLVDQLVTKVV